MAGVTDKMALYAAGLTHDHFMTYSTFHEFLCLQIRKRRFADQTFFFHTSIPPVHGNSFGLFYDCYHHYISCHLYVNRSSPDNPFTDLFHHKNISRLLNNFFFSHIDSRLIFTTYRIDKNVKDMI